MLLSTDHWLNPHKPLHLTTAYAAYPNYLEHTAQKKKFSIKDFFSKCDQIRNCEFDDIH